MGLSSSLPAGSDGWQASKRILRTWLIQRVQMDGYVSLTDGTVMEKLT
jgi:hypothetical protein